MKPYYQDSACTIFHGDCREIIPTLPKVDLVLTDPPYGMNWNTDSRRFSGGEHKRGDGRNHKPVVGDNEAFDPSLFVAFPKVILWGSNHYAAALPTGTTLVWVKRHPELFGSFLSDCEIGWMKGGHGVYAFYKQFPPPVRASEAGGDPCNPKTVHPNQKPLALMGWCIELAGDGVRTILDPFMGSGTVLQAAKERGLEAVGIEIDEEYCESAALRLQQEVLPLTVEQPKQPIAQELFA